MRVGIARGRLCAAGEAGGCGQCGACRRVESGQHPDLIVVERPSDRARIPVEEVRRAIAELGRGAVEGRGRVAIVVRAEELMREGQNALLKTLEEPAPKTCLVLTTERPETLLDTVRSRCERVVLAAPGEDELAAGWRAQGLDAGSAERIARLSGGNRRRGDRIAAIGLPELERSLAPLLDEAPAGSVQAWIAERLEGASSRAAKIELGKETLGLALALLRERGRDGDPAAWDRIDRVLDALGELNLGISPEIVLSSLLVGA